MACKSTSDLARETSANASREGSIIGEDARRVIYPLMPLLLEGKPAPVSEIAERSDLPPGRAQFILDELGAERNEAGEITGLGLTLEPTPHEYRVGGKTFYTWCAPDTLLFPKVLDHTARVVSSDPVSDEKITLTVSPEGVQELNPPTAVVSWTREADGRDIRGTFCRYGRFFVRPQTATRWQQDHPKIEILEVEEALEAIRQMDSFLGS